jgi:hypothetical protein
MKTRKTQDEKDFDKFAEKFATICNLIEAIWLKRKAKDYYEINLEDLPPLTSPQARKIAGFIFDVLEVEI